LYVRINVTIGRPKHFASEVSERIVADANDKLERRQELHDLVDKAAGKGKQVSQFENDLKPIDNKFAKISEEFAALIAEAEGSESSKDIAVRLKEIEKKAKARYNAHKELHRLEFRKKSLDKDKYEQTYQSLKAQADQEISFDFY